MTEKRYLLKYIHYGNREVIEEGEPYFIDTKEKVFDKYGYYTIDGYPVMSDKQVLDLLNENEQLKEDIEYLDEKIKENEWHWNTIDEDRDVWAYKCKQAEKQVKELEEDLNYALNRIEERSIDIQLLKEENRNLKKENELKGDFRNFINEDIVRIKNENEQLKQFKELLCAVLKQEYEDRTNEMNIWAEKEDWNGYRATKLEYGTVIRIAKRIGVDLE